MVYRGRWHGDQVYFGLHYDLHASEQDTVLGTHCTPEELIPTLKLMDPDLVQTDCKGHPGMTSWYTQTPTGTVSPGVQHDALRGWRDATRALGLPLHCHYSGIWDRAAARKFPDWRVVPNPDEPAPDRADGFSPKLEKMCPRGPYVDELLIPQLFELIDRYEIDGFWVDGEVWAVEFCYCERCRAAFRAESGLEAPTRMDDPHWVTWAAFQRKSFQNYVAHYCEAVHQHKPGVLVCSNWSQTFKDPGEPWVPTDWISGDALVGTDPLRCEARFISTRGKPWDIMIWAFYKTGAFGDRTQPWTFKPPEMLEQESAIVLALGGNLQIYETPTGLRDGRLVPWRMERLGEVGRYAKERRALCQGTETIPQIAVLHSEAHYYSQPVANIYWAHDVAPVEGAVFSLLDNSYGVDILDEWALLPRLTEFPVVVVPEQHNLSEAAVQALKDYVQNGGRLLVSGAESYARFGAEFLGAEAGEWVQEPRVYHIPVSGGAFPLYSASWRLLQPTTAERLGTLGRTPLLDAELLPNPAATLNRVGQGCVVYASMDLFRYSRASRFPWLNGWVGELVEALDPQWAIRVHAPSCVDVILRQKAGRKIIHLINRTPPSPNFPQNGSASGIPTVGPITLEFKLARKPTNVQLVYEASEGEWEFCPNEGSGEGGVLTATIPGVHIHLALVIE